MLMALRGAGIGDLGVLSAMERTPRDAFAAPEDSDRAWDDAPLPIAGGLGLWRPYVTAVLLGALEVGDRDRVLLAPTGTGYEAAVLSGLCRWVYTPEPSRDRRRAAEERLKALGLKNVVTQVGAPASGWPAQAPFDRIWLNEGMDEIPSALMKQLRPGGVMVAVVGPDPAMRRVIRYQRSDDGMEHKTLLALNAAVTAGARPD